MPHMLVLSRRLNEKLVFPEINAAVQVVSVRPGLVRLGIEAPPEVTVLRAEIAPQADANLPAPLRRRLEGATAALARLRRQLAGGDADTGATLDQIEEELRALRQQVEQDAACPALAGR
jgi:carbon storage regulator CsrA